MSEPTPRIEIPFTEDLDEMERAHLAAVVDAALDDWLGADETVTPVARAIYEAQWGISWNRRAERGESSAHRRSARAALATLTERTTP